jgi:membrane-associated protease RseP (regulator of RpoE activity)
MPDMPTVVIPRIEVPQFEIRGTTARAGLIVENLTPQLAQYFGCRNGEGVLVRSVEKGSAAAAAGFKAGDVIVRIDKDKITDITDLRMTMRQHRAGKVPVGILRDKKEQTLTLTLSAKERSANVIELPDMSATMEELDHQMELLGPELEKTTEAATQVASAEFARQQVELHKAMNEARKQAYKELKKHRKEIEKAQKEAQKAAREAEKQIESSIDEE